MSQKIIAFSGKKQGGKTTAVNYLRQVLDISNHTVDTINFADALKHFVVETFCPARGSGACGAFDIENNKNIILPCGKTVREVLQICGTDWFRTLDPDYWVKKWKVAVLHSRAEIILVGDVRFPNEIRAVQSLGGKVIRLLRNPFPDDKHASETALDQSGSAFDWTIDNSQMSIVQQDIEAVRAIQRLYPELASLFNGE